MKCPVDDDTLALAERSGVEIDYCPTCRGVWLDRGELDKIIERAEAELHSGSQDRSQPDRRDGYDRGGRRSDHDRDRGRSDHDRDRSRSDHDGGYRGDSGRRKSRTSWIGDLFGD
jgi:Zn-finger nucleic acid-binding protein